ncbi:MAG: glycoside hydrolase family 16 protein [Salinivirgaceae bacterium]|jgi:beta-glucanase (GH16 family)|nr:glycoside hydrolase family 16 protein [Salinivirgaceae bacterium]
MKKQIYLILILFITTNISVFAQWELIWSDDFDETSLDTTKWLYATGINPHNNEQQYYTDLEENIRVNDGLLTIEVLEKEVEGKDYTSARLNSKETWCYGKMEIKAKLTKGVGVWPAIWMYPENEIYGNWPRSGEIDIMEYWSWDSVGIYGNAHCEEFNHMKHAERQGRFANATPSEEFHVYGLEWYKDQMTWLVDGKVFLTIYNDNTIESYPFDHPFKFILNVAVESVGPGNEHTWIKRTMEIDYVKVYKGPENGPEAEVHNIPGTIKADAFYKFKGAKKEANTIQYNTDLLLHNTDFLSYNTNCEKQGLYNIKMEIANTDTLCLLNIKSKNQKTTVEVPVNKTNVLTSIDAQLFLSKGLQTIDISSSGNLKLSDLNIEFISEKAVKN